MKVEVKMYFKLGHIPQRPAFCFNMSLVKRVTLWDINSFIYKSEIIISTFNGYFIEIEMVYVKHCV